jgi:hypothetical protein
MARMKVEWIACVLFATQGQNFRRAVEWPVRKTFEKLTLELLPVLWLWLEVHGSLKVGDGVLCSGASRPRCLVCSW